MQGQAQLRHHTEAYHEWESGREIERVESKPVDDAQLELANYEAANDTDVAEEEALVVSEEATGLQPVADTNENTAEKSASERTEIAADGGSGAEEPVVEMGTTDERGTTEEDEPKELTLEEALECGGQSWVQHAGSWIMLAVLERMGLYRLAEKNRRAKL